MESNKTLFIISVIVVVFVTMVAILYTNKVKPSNGLTETNYDIKVYKSHENAKVESGHSYAECEVDPANKAILVAEFNRISALGEKNEITNASINGTYRVDYNGAMIAFDNDTDHIVYVAKNNKLYVYDSTIYKKVIEYCG